jgi:hypothetical protein
MLLAALLKAGYFSQKALPTPHIFSNVKEDSLRACLIVHNALQQQDSDGVHFQ